MRIILLMLGGFILDGIFGDPAWLVHPVVIMGKGNYRAGKVSQKTLAKHARGRTAGRAHSGYVTAGRYIADYRRRLLAVL